MNLCSVSIIIPTYNRPNDLKNTLNSIIQQTLLPKEVIIVDQSENVLTKELVEFYDHVNKTRGINFIWHYQNEKGSAKARNNGFHISSGEIISFTDDDVVLDKDYIKQIVNCFDKYPHIGGISGNVEVLNTPSGFKWLLRSFLLRIFLIDCLNGKMTASGFGFPIFRREIKNLTYVELFAGYSMNFRKQYLEEDLFDEFFTGYSFREDVELSYRISRKTKIAMLPEARFQHNVSLSNRTELEFLKRMQFRNYYFVFNKHKNHSVLSMILFIYSIFGTLLIDFIEWLLGFKKLKWDTFLTDLSAVNELIKGKL